MPPLGLDTRHANGGASSALLSRQPRPSPRLPARLNRRAVAAGATPNDSSKGRAPSGRSRLSRLLSWRSVQPAAAEEAKAGFPSEASSAAEAATVEQWEEEQQVAAAALSLEQQEQCQRQPTVAAEQQPEVLGEEQQAVTGPAATARPGSFSLYSWLTWGSGSAPSTAASSSDEEGSSADEATQRSRRLAATAELADGMAATEPQLSGSSAAPTRSSSSYWRNSWYSLSRSSLSTSGSFDEADPATAAAAAGARWQQRVPIDHPALQLLRQRALSGSRPGQRRDPFKLGLVVEGGGMRGCVSGGALQALTDLGLRDTFDAVYGSSAGAINSTYFLSGAHAGWLDAWWGMGSGRQVSRQQQVQRPWQRAPARTMWARSVGTQQAFVCPCSSEIQR